MVPLCADALLTSMKPDPNRIVPVVGVSGAARAPAVVVDSGNQVAAVVALVADVAGDAARAGSPRRLSH